jgi:hypothetical protein
MTIDPEESMRESRPLARWRGPALRASLATLVFSIATGSMLIFFRRYLRHSDTLGLLHWTAAGAALPVWAIYLLRHYLRVRPGGRPVHFYVGVATFFTLLAVTLTGMPLVFPEFAAAAQALIDLAHIVCGFIVVILLAVHLILVTRVAGVATGAPAIRGSVRVTLFWITLAAMLFALTAGLWVAR